MARLSRADQDDIMLAVVLSCFTVLGEMGASYVELMDHNLLRFRAALRLDDDKLTRIIEDARASGSGLQWSDSRPQEPAC